MGAAPSSQPQERTPTLASHDAAKPKDQEPTKPNSATPPPATTTATTEVAATRPDSLLLAEVAKAREALAKETKEAVKEAAAKKDHVPHMYEKIIRQADNAAAASGDLLDRVRGGGIFLDNKRKKYWVEEKTGYNCFMLFARDLLITWSESPDYWQWVRMKETSETAEEIEAASLANVCWLEVHGRFDTALLNPGAAYDVAFVVMMEPGYGWAAPVNLRLALPDGSVQQRKESLLEKPRGRWVELKAGELTTRRDGKTGQLECSLYEYEGGHWKRGLVVKGVVIRPKKK